MSDPDSPQGQAQAWLSRQWAAFAPFARRHAIWLSLGAAVLAGLLVFLLLRAARPGPDEGLATGSLPGGASPGGDAVSGPGPAVPSEPQAVGLQVDAGAPPSPNVKVVFRTYPGRRATVMWGGKRLGIIERGKPLVIERPRDSGPMDVVIRSPGYLPVYTRAYTFDDASVDVRITPLDKKDTIFGYREPLADAGADPVN